MSANSIVSIVVFLTACGEITNSSPDGGVDATRVDSPAHPIAGRWITALGVEVEYTTDHYYFAEGQQGTWFVDGNTVVRNIDGHVLRTQFYLSEDIDTLVVGAKFPTTSTTGLVATWHGESADGTIKTIDTIDYRADNTLTWTVTFGSTGPVDLTGTWSLDGDRITVDLVESNTEVEEYVIPDVVVGSMLLRRI